MGTMISFQGVLNSISTQTLFRTTRSCGFVRIIFVSTITQRGDMTSVTDFISLKQLCSPGNPESARVCLVYMLRRRCAERKPVIWYDGQHGYIFVEDGVYNMSPDFLKNEYKIFVWTLVDSDEAPDGIPPELVRRRTRLFVIYASSPNGDRWKRLHKTVDPTTVVMNPWTWGEMLRVLPILLPDTELTDAEIRETFKQLGPTPRIIQQLSQPDELEEYKSAVSIAISTITPDKLKKLVHDARSFSMKTDDLNAISHKLGLISRVERNNMHSTCIVTPMTESIQTMLARQLRIVSRNEQIELYRLFRRSPQTMKMCGTLFEAIGLSIIPEGLTFELLPMVCLPREPNSKNRPRWYSSHKTLTNKDLEARRKEALHVSKMIQFKATNIEEFKAGDVLSLLEGTFYIPMSDNQDSEALDAFLFLNGILYILQFTVAQNHSIKPGFVDFLQSCQNVPPLEEWMFVFLIPPGLTLLCPEPKSQLPGLHNLNPYSAELDLKPFLTRI